MSALRESLAHLLATHGSAALLDALADGASEASYHVGECGLEGGVQFAVVAQLLRRASLRAALAEDRSGVTLGAALEVLALEPAAK